jgi:hypothetical protein
MLGNALFRQTIFKFNAVLSEAHFDMPKFLRYTAAGIDYRDYF